MKYYFLVLWQRKFIFKQNNHMRWLKMLNIILAYIIFFLMMPVIFSPEVKKKSFLISFSLSIAICVVFISVIGLKYERRWGLEGLLISYASLLLCLFFLHSYHFFLYLIVLALLTTAVSGLFLHKKLKGGF